MMPSKKIILEALMLKDLQRMAKFIDLKIKGRPTKKIFKDALNRIRRISIENMLSCLTLNA